MGDTNTQRVIDEHEKTLKVVAEAKTILEEAKQVLERTKQ